jgi:aminoglycoside phosphotransferase (APT) family kinase protein
VICRIGGKLHAVSQRKSVSRATLEAAVLGLLAPTGLSPKLICQDGCLVVQEYIPGRRLSEHLDVGNAEALMAKAAGSLLAAQKTATDSELSHQVPAIGIRPGWEADLMNAPAQLAKRLCIDIPPYDFARLLSFAPEQMRSFVKWDARPGNAILRENGRICWIDWEHAGVRRPVDDLIWLFSDEWAPNAPEALELSLGILARRQGCTYSDIKAVFQAGAVAHSAIRLLLIFSHKGTGAWWNREACLKYDRVGVTAEHVRLVALRASEWSETVTGLENLSDFFRTIAHQAV